MWSPVWYLLYTCITHVNLAILGIFDYWLPPDPPAQVRQKTISFQQYLSTECWLFIIITYLPLGGTSQQQWGPALLSHTWHVHVPLPRHNRVLVTPEQCNVQTCPEISRYLDMAPICQMWIEFNYNLFTVAAQEQSWLKTDERIIVKHNDNDIDNWNRHLISVFIKTFCISKL